MTVSRSIVSLSSFIKTILLVGVLFAPRLLSAADTEPIVIGGSGGPLAAMRIMVKEFTRSHRAAKITVMPSLGSGGGIKAVIAGKLDIGLSARPLNENEQPASARELARTPFVFATKKKNPPEGFTLRQLTDIYAGKTTNWPDGQPLRIVVRPASEYDTSILSGMSPQMADAIIDALKREGANMAITDQDSANAIEKVPGAMGTTTVAQIISEKRPFKVLAVNGLTPVQHPDRYPYFKTYYVVTGPNTRHAARQFIDFIFSARGRDILTRCGFQVLSK